MAGQGLANHPAEGLIPTPSSQPPTLGCRGRIRQRVTFAAAASSASWGVWEPGEYLPSRSRFHPPLQSLSDPGWMADAEEQMHSGTWARGRVVERTSFHGGGGGAVVVAGSGPEDKPVTFCFSECWGWFTTWGFPRVPRRWPDLETKARE